MFLYLPINVEQPFFYSQGQVKTEKCSLIWDAFCDIDEEEEKV